MTSAADSPDSSNVRAEPQTIRLRAGGDLFFTQATVKRDASQCLQLEPEIGWAHAGQERVAFQLCLRHFRALSQWRKKVGHCLKMRVTRPPPMNPMVLLFMVSPFLYPCEFVSIRGLDFIAQFQRAV